MRVRVLQTISWPHGGGEMHARFPGEYDLPEAVALQALAEGHAELLDPVEPEPPVAEHAPEPEPFLLDDLED